MRHAGTPRAGFPRAPGEGGPVAALAVVASQFSPEARAEKLRILAALPGARFTRPRTLVRLHETLCFLQAYPDAGRVLARVDSLLRDFGARTRALGARRLAGLHDTGIVGSTLEYPFGLPLSRWLAARLGPGADIAWTAVDGEKVAEALDLLVTPSERDAFSEGGFTVRGWLEVARAGRRLTDLQVLVEAFDRAPLDPELRDWLYESLGLPVRVRLDVPDVSRTLAKRPAARVFFQRTPLRRAGVDVVRETVRPLPSLRRAEPRLAGALIETARVAMATRSRELYAFSYPNVEDVLVGEMGRGLRGVLIGLQPEFRLPFEGYYAFLAIKNDVPVGYGGGWCLFETLEFGFNIFESFRQGESAWILAQVLRAYHRVFGMRTVVVDPYQLGEGNPEALRSGALYFYQRLGFQPRSEPVRRVLDEELVKIARDRAYRSPLPVLRRLARAEACLTLPGGSAAPERRVRARDLAALVTRDVARRHAGDREAHMREALARVSRALGLARLAGWTDPERRAFRQWAPVVALLPSLDRWSPRDRARLVGMIRAKGGRGEGPYVRRLLGLAPLARALEALVRPMAPGGRQARS